MSNPNLNSMTDSELAAFIRTWADKNIPPGSNIMKVLNAVIPRLDGTAQRASYRTGGPVQFPPAPGPTTGEGA